MTSNAEIVTFLNSGTVFLANTIPKDLLKFASGDSSNITHSNGFIINSGTVDVGDRITMVRRNGIICDELPENHIYAHTSAITTTSLFKGNSIFPKWYIQNGRVFIKPNPTTNSAGQVTFIDIPTISTNTSNTVFSSIENPMLLYAAALDCVAVASEYGILSLSSLHEDTGDARDALDKAKVLIDDSTELSQGEDVEYYIAQEDPEMMLANVQTAAQEVNRALAEIRDIEGTSKFTVEFLQRSDLLFKQADREVELYVMRNTKMMGLQAMLQTQQGRQK